jgi:hypothetical protein
MNVCIYTNGTFEEEAALVINNELVVSGDYYHNKINDYIQGFIAGIEYITKSIVGIMRETIMPDHPMFSQCNFYNDKEEFDVEDYENEEDE